jgi:hypothetical protein
LLVVGCSVLKKEIGVPVDPAEIGLLEGETHYRTVLAQMGPPGKVSALSEGLSFLYEYARTDEKQIGFGFSELGLPVLRWFKFSAARGRADHQALLLIFDDQGILRSQEFDEYHENLGAGGSLQFFLTVAPLIDSSFLEDEIGPNQWGTALLRPLPQTLNSRQSLDTGHCGLEQDGTPPSVGQHTLEMR